MSAADALPSGPLADALDDLTDDDGNRWSLWSRDSLLCIGCHSSVLSIGSVGSVLSVGSAGSALSVLSVGSAGAAGSVMSSLSRWSLLSHRSSAAVAGDGRRGDSPVPALLVTAVAATMAAGWLRERRRG